MCCLSLFICTTLNIEITWVRNVNNALQPQVGRWHQPWGRDVILESIISVVFAFDDAERDFRVCKGQDVNVEERGVTLVSAICFQSLQQWRQYNIIIRGVIKSSENDYPHTMNACCMHFDTYARNVGLSAIITKNSLPNYIALTIERMVNEMGTTDRIGM